MKLNGLKQDPPLSTGPHLYMRAINGRECALQTASTLDNRRLLILFVVVTAVIMIDYEFGLIADFIPEIVSSNNGILLFVSTAVIFAIASLIIQFENQY